MSFYYFPLWKKKRKMLIKCKECGNLTPKDQFCQSCGKSPYGHFCQSCGKSPHGHSPHHEPPYAPDYHKVMSGEETESIYGCCAFLPPTDKKAIEKEKMRK